MVPGEAVEKQVDHLDCGTVLLACGEELFVEGGKAGGEDEVEHGKGDWLLA